MSETGKTSRTIEWVGDIHGFVRQTDPPIWSREGNTVVVSSPDRNVWPKLLCGDTAWESYELKVRATLIQGSNLYINFRESDEGHYQFGFLPGAQAMGIAKIGPEGLTKLDLVNYVVEKGKDYNISVAVRHHSITSYVDGKLVNRVTDGTYPRGRVGFGVGGKNAIARFRDPQIRISGR